MQFTGHRSECPLALAFRQLIGYRLSFVKAQIPVAPVETEYDVTIGVASLVGITIGLFESLCEMSSETTKPVIVSIHGIRTHAHWQKTIGREMEACGIAHEAFDYGRFGAVALLLPGRVEKIIEQLIEAYERVLDDKRFGLDVDNPATRPSILAHSLGTYLVGHLLLKYSHVKFDKVALCGSILPRSFPWTRIVMRDQVTRVLNSHSRRDIWTRVASHAIREAGDSGAFGFDEQFIGLEERSHDLIRHSDYFHESFVRKEWVPFFAKPSLPYRLLHGRDVIGLEGFRKIFPQTRNIDSLVYGSDPSYSSATLPQGLSLEWVSINPDIYTFLVDATNDAVVGYINAMPLDEACFRGVMAGKIDDPDVAPGDILPFAEGSQMSVYLMSFALHPDVQNKCAGLRSVVFERLVAGLCNKLVEMYVEKGVQVMELGATAWTDAGTRLCKMLGLKRVGEDRFGHVTYSAKLDSNLLSNQTVWPGLRRLAEAYSRPSRVMAQAKRKA